MQVKATRSIRETIIHTYTLDTKTGEFEFITSEKRIDENETPFWQIKMPDREILEVEGGRGNVVTTLAHEFTEGGTARSVRR